MHVDLLLPGRKRFTKTFALYGPITPEDSKYTILGTKTEITLAKADARSWPSITALDPSLAKNFVAQLAFSAGEAVSLNPAQADRYSHIRSSSQAVDVGRREPRKPSTTTRTARRLGFESELLDRLYVPRVSRAAFALQSLLLGAVNFEKSWSESPKAGSDLTSKPSVRGAALKTSPLSDYVYARCSLQSAALHLSRQAPWTSEPVAELLHGVRPSHTRFELQRANRSTNAFLPSPTAEHLPLVTRFPTPLCSAKRECLSFCLLPSCLPPSPLALLLRPLSASFSSLHTPSRLLLQEWSAPPSSRPSPSRLSPSSPPSRLPPGELSFTSSACLSNPRSNPQRGQLHRTRRFGHLMRYRRRSMPLRLLSFPRVGGFLLRLGLQC